MSSGFHVLNIYMLESAATRHYQKQHESIFSFQSYQSILGSDVLRNNVLSCIFKVLKKKTLLIHIFWR